MSKKLFILSLAIVLMISGCTSTKTTSNAITPPTVESYSTQFNGEKRNLAVGQFVNSSNFQNGLFSNGQDVLGKQAKTALLSNLHQTTRFNVLDRDNLDIISQEVGRSGEELAITSARYILTGDVTEFGRRAVSDIEFFGLLGRGKK